MQDRLDILILGCGFTGRRVAQRFLARGSRVTATSRRPEQLHYLGVEAICVEDVSRYTREGMLVLHSIPPKGPKDLLEPLKGTAKRVVYLSSTAVYGPAIMVDETTPTRPDTPAGEARFAVERSVLEGPWSSLILRPAAIYGPGRGVQESIQRGEHSMSDRFVSRIHVDDLARIAEAALLSNLPGVFPVADEEPCTSRQIAEFCAALLKIPVTGPGNANAAGAGYADRPPRFANNRRVDGRAICRSLGIMLRYPTFRLGVPASLGPVEREEDFR